jgi:hypothetical protein
MVNKMAARSTSHAGDLTSHTTASPIAMATAPAAARRRGNTDFIGIPSWFPDAEVEETRLGRPFGQQEMNDGRRSTEIRALFRP